MRSAPYYKNNMRTFLISFLVLVSVLLIHAPVTHADLPGTTNGSSCNNGAGVVQDGVCINVGPGNDAGSAGPGNTGTQLINPLKSGTTLEGFLNSILSFVIRIGAIVIVLMLVYVGYLFVVARGAPGEIEAAKKALLWTIIGALVLLGAQAISLAIQETVKALSAGT